MFIRALVIVLAMNSACFAGSSLAENKAKQADHTHVVERTVSGIAYAWVERAGVQCSVIYSGAHAHQQAQSFANSIK